MSDAEFWRGRRVLVTGAAGFIGSHFVEALLARGAQLTAFVRYTSRWTIDRLVTELDGIRVVPGDLQEAESVAEAVRDQEVVFHLAALVGIPYSFQHPREVVETNLIGTLNVLSAAREMPGCRVVLFSSSEVYGTAQYVPIDENHPLRAQSPYAASKIGAEKLAESFAKSYGLDVRILRPFNTYGPRQSGRAVIPTILAQALRGDQVRLGASTPTRDFLYVEDTVAGALAVAEASDVAGEVFNLGTGRETAIAEVIQLVGRLLGRELVVIEEAQRLRPARGEVQRLCADASKARSLLGWMPGYSLETGLAKTLAWLAGAPEAIPPRYQV